jgi:hypothetical protein
MESLRETEPPFFFCNAKKLKQDSNFEHNTNRNWNVEPILFVVSFGLCFFFEINRQAEENSKETAKQRKRKQKVTSITQQILRGQTKNRMREN